MPSTNLEILIKQDETAFGIPFWITHAADLQATAPLISLAAGKWAANVVEPSRKKQQCTC